MKDHQIIKTGDRFTVVENRPREIASFEDEGHANLFLSALSQEVRATVDRQTPPSSKTTEVVPVEVKPVERAPSPSPTPPKEEPVMPKVRAAEAEKKRASEAKYEKALRRIEGGEQCKKVAEDMGLPFGVLRAKWGVRVKQNKGREAVPAEAPDRVARKETVWTNEMEVQLMHISDGEVAEFASLYGVSTVEAHRKREAMFREVQKIIDEPDEGLIE
jgi:hypothetical protein